MCSACSALSPNATEGEVATPLIKLPTYSNTGPASVPTDQSPALGVLSCAFTLNVTANAHAIVINFFIIFKV